MRTDTEFIEAFLLHKLGGEELRTFTARRSADRPFSLNVIAQAKVHLAVLLYGRSRRRAQILAAEEKVFADPEFRKEVSALFQ